MDPQHALNHAICRQTKNQSTTVVTRGYESYGDCLKLAEWSFLYALVRVIHPDWLIRWNFRLRVSDTESHQNSWISTDRKKTSICYWLSYRLIPTVEWVDCTTYQKNQYPLYTLLGFSRPYLEDSDFTNRWTTWAWAQFLEHSGNGWHKSLCIFNKNTFQAFVFPCTRNILNRDSFSRPANLPSVSRNGPLVSTTTKDA